MSDERRTVDLARSESLTDPIVRAVDLSLGTLIGLNWFFCTGWLEWVSLLALGPLWRGFRPPRVHVGLDGIAHRSLLATTLCLFEDVQKVDVQRLSKYKCQVTIGNYSSNWVKPFGLDEAERTGLRDWLCLAIDDAQKGLSLSRKFAVDLDLIADADDSVLAQLSTCLGTNAQVRVLAIATLVLHGSKRLEGVRGITDHILLQGTRKLIRRAFKVTSMADFDELKRSLATAAVDS